MIPPIVPSLPPVLTFVISVLHSPDLTCPLSVPMTPAWTEYSVKYLGNTKNVLHIGASLIKADLHCMASTFLMHARLFQDFKCIVLDIHCMPQEDSDVNAFCIIFVDVFKKCYINPYVPLTTGSLQMVMQ